MRYAGRVSNLFGQEAVQELHVAGVWVPGDWELGMIMLQAQQGRDGPAACF